MRSNATVFSEWLESLAQRYGNQPALVCDNDTMTYSQLLDASLRCAADLAERGVKKGDSVILMGVNGLDWLVSFFGIVLAGGVAALTNYSLNSKDTVTLTRLVDAKWAVLGVDDVFGIRPETVAQSVETGGVPSDHILNSRKLYETASDPGSIPDPAIVRALAALTKPQDTQMIIFTTGTTSLPKAVQLSSASILSNTYGFLEILEGDIGKAACLALPLFHAYGMTMELGLLEVGSTVFLPREITPQSVLDVIERGKIDTMFSVGTVYRLLMGMPKFEENGRNRIKSCIWGGSAMAPADLEKLEKILVNAYVVPAYGLSECSPVVSMGSRSIPTERRAVTVGRPLSNVDVRIWEEERGFLPQGEIGEILVSGPCVMNGYLGLSIEEQPIDAEGWLHTGDRGIITEDGLLQLRGRIKDLIKRAGENISPGEIEEALLEEPSITDAKVIGLPHPILGESVEACVVLREGELDERRLKAALRKKLSSYKIPDHIVPFSGFPLNTNGKVNQLRLKEMLMERLGADQK